MKPFKAALAALGVALLIYLAFCFGQATFDITRWGANADEAGRVRAMCAVYMLMFGAAAFCGVKALE